MPAATIAAARAGEGGYVMVVGRQHLGSPGGGRMRCEVVTCRPSGGHSSSSRRQRGAAHS